MKFTQSALKWGGAALLALLAASQASAAGTAADTLISNTATANYAINGSAADPVSDSADFRVDEIIDVTTVKVGGVVTVQPGDTNRLISFDVTNTGNGEEIYDITVDPVVGGDDFDLAVSQSTDIFLDDGDAIFEPGGGDTAFDPSTDDLTLLADETQRIFVRSDIPGGAADGETGDVLLLAETTTGALAGATAGTVAAGLGTSPSGDGIDAVVGTTQGSASDSQTYVVSAVAVTVNKTIDSVVDPFGGTTRVPGSVVTYSIVVEVTGSGTAQDLVISDSIPAVSGGEGIAYVQGSVTVNTFGVTDAVDGDSTQVNFNVPGDVGSSGDLAPGGVTVQVDFGDVSPAGGTVTNTILLDAEIQ